MSHADWKQKHGKAHNNSVAKHILLANMANEKAKQSVKDHFYRPLYGKLGERGECYERNNEDH